MPLDEAFQVALADNDGCFVYFGGITCVIGKTESGFFVFDSHSRSFNGMLSVSGKSVRVLFDNLFEVYSHIQNLALSMGYSNSIECNLTGLSCLMNFTENDGNLLKMENGSGVLSEKSMLSEQENVKTSNQNDDVIIINQEQCQFSFCPLNTNLRKELCQKLSVPYICTENSADMLCSKTNMATPRTEKEIICLLCFVS